MKWFTGFVLVCAAFAMLLGTPSFAGEGDDWSFTVSVISTAGEDTGAFEQQNAVESVEVVCFTSQNCRPCKDWTAVEQVRLQNAGHKVRIVDGTDLKYRRPWSVTNSAGQKFTVQPVIAYPTIMIFRDGVPVWRQTGYAAANTVSQHIPRGS